MNKICKNCGNQFEQHAWYHLFCSEKCRHQYRDKVNPSTKFTFTNNLVRKCVVCAKEFLPNINNPHQRFCSNKCRYHSRYLHKKEISLDFYCSKIEAIAKDNCSEIQCPYCRKAIILNSSDGTTDGRRLNDKRSRTKGI
jgi:endogenous inhibitor of DNA gyrase (YacG/DUF329 family)